MPTVGVVLAAGGSSRLGRPKQLLPFRDRTLLDAALDVARACGFAQLVVTIGGAADEVRERVDLHGCTVVDNARFTDGCSSSIVTALEVLRPDADALMLLLGDQPGVAPEVVRRLDEEARRPDADGGVPSIAVCRYENGIGHPFRFGRETFGDLRDLHGDKGVWRLVESGRWTVREMTVDAPVPPDVDTWDDYEQLVGSW